MISFRKNYVYCRQEIKISDKNRKWQGFEITEDYPNCQSVQVQFPVEVKAMTEKETKEYHLKKLLDLSLRSVGEISQLEVPTDQQKEWVLYRLKQPTECWQRWFIGQYFTRGRKVKMRLTDKNIGGGGVE
jgi:hypothetical protein